MSRGRPLPIRRSARIVSLIASALGVVYAAAVGYPVPATAQSTTYEAEAAALSGGAAVASDHTGYTGSGFVAGYVDGNKGNANTMFTVSAASTGSYTLNLRYANGTSAQMSLSLYVNGSKLQQLLLPATADWNTWTTQTVTTTLAAGTDTVAYKFDTTDLGNVNLDNLAVTSVTPPQPGQYEAEAGSFNSGPTVATAIAGYSGSGYLTGFTSQGARVIVAASVPSAGTYAVGLRYANTSGSAQSISLYLNGLKSQQLSLAAASGWQSVSLSLSLRSGLNLIGYQTDSGDTGNVAVDQVTVTGGQSLAASGATLPYTEYRAASASTNATVLPANRNYPSIQSESTGRQAVQLTSTGQYVQITLTAPANSIVVRYSIPANADGSTATAQLALYANGSPIKDLSLTTKYSWLYGGGYTDTHSPSNGPAHHFYDETRALIGNWPAGTVLKLQKDAADTAASYTIDVIDTEQVDPAFTMPANFVPITNYGVTPNSGADTTAAINGALSSLAGTGKGLWFPSGSYNISGQISVNGVAIRGAGQWYTTLQATTVNGSAGLFTTGGTNQIADLTISGGQVDRNNNAGAAGIEGTFNAGSMIFDVWIEHTKVGLWLRPAIGTYIAGVRVRDVFADGIHLHGGSTNSRVDQSQVRNTGDDQVALDSEDGTVTGCSATYNTVQSPIQANGIGVYGGANNSVQNNAVIDTVAFGSGITISTAFGGGFSGPTTVSGNTLTRASSYNSNWGSALGALWIYASVNDITQPVTVTNNTINDSTYQGILLSFGKQISNLTLDHVSIAGTGTYGIDIENVTGSMSASYVTVTGAASGGLNNPGGYTINRGPGNSGW
jgi:hypothetical protein